MTLEERIANFLNAQNVGSARFLSSIRFDHRLNLLAELKVSLGAHIESDIVVQIRFNLYFGLTDQKLDSNQPFLINQLING